jgi:uncharacterized membrane protein
MLSNATNRVWIVYAAVVGLALLWLLAIVAVPWLMCRGDEMTATVLYRGFALVCHQQGARSFHWCGWPLAVCARCLGIYAGALLGLLLYPRWRSLNTLALPARRYLVVALAPLFIDWALGALGIIASPAVTRMATGLLAGSTAAFYLLPVLLALGSGRESFARPAQQHQII